MRVGEEEREQGMMIAESERCRPEKSRERRATLVCEERRGGVQEKSRGQGRKGDIVRGGKGREG
eukprot:673671-Hanusia_phi.AAC.1